MTRARRELGQAGERLAEKFLRRLGYRRLARNYVTPVGEIDLIMRDGDTVVFVEIKTRRSAALADPVEQLRPAQQRHLLKATEWFLARSRHGDAPCRYDVVGITLREGEEPVIEHVVDAFGPRR
jgi:putative endonuclease